MTSFGGKGSLTEMNELINHEGDYRTAPATPGLLMTTRGVLHMKDLPCPQCQPNQTYCTAVEALLTLQKL